MGVSCGKLVCFAYIWFVRAVGVVGRRMGGLFPHAAGVVMETWELSDGRELFLIADVIYQSH